jgi:TRIAD3 protein (E3 ubiquitin-protein ligase RNF216)
MEAIRKLNSKHTVEDAMSEALIRKCPKCDKAYMKETGCNKITVRVKLLGKKAVD